MNLLNKKTNSSFNSEFRLLFKFSFTGLLNTLVDFMVFTLCNSLFGIHYTISQIIGYSSGVANSFIFNKKWTFKARHSRKKIYHELFQFIFTNVISLSFTLLFMNFAINTFKANVYVAKIAATAIAQIINFLSYKLWVFTKEEN